MQVATGDVAYMVRVMSALVHKNRFLEKLNDSQLLIFLGLITLKFLG
jgi:hypothetical protein